MRVGTRPSAMALAQAKQVATLLPGEHEIVPVVTAGDRDRSVRDKGDWVGELERALLAQRVDLLVHSAKDLPIGLADGCLLAGVPVRDDPRDVLCGAEHLARLPSGATVGTSSLRRGAWLRATRPDLVVRELRGNVDTRLSRLHAGQVDAIVVGLAGLRRLGRQDAVGAVLEDLLPAAGQGALALEVRADDVAAAAAAAAVTDPTSHRTLLCERSLVRTLGADCHSALGAHAESRPNGRLRLRAFVSSVDGADLLEDLTEGTDPHAVGVELGKRLLARGAGNLLHQ